jgi:uncharacterized protein
LKAYFVDTSAVVKRYVPEVGTQWVLGWILPSAGSVVVISELTRVEIFSVFARREREQSLSTINANLLRSNFLAHAQKEYLITPLNTDIVEDARMLVTKYPLRSLDAIQLASANQAQTILGEPMTFVSADARLLSILPQEGFAVDNPENYL